MKMPRPCVCCALEEIRMQLDEKIRQGISYAEIAREYAAYKISPDSVERHARSHVLKTKPNGKLDAAAVFHEIATRAGEIARSATATGDLRSACDALMRQASAAESYARISESKKQAEAKKLISTDRISIEQMDSIVARVESNFDRCPTCGFHSILKPAETFTPL